MLPMIALAVSEVTAQVEIKNLWVIDDNPVYANLADNSKPSNILGSHGGMYRYRSI